METTLTQSAGSAGADPHITPPKLAIVLEGGLVQAVVSDRPEDICMDVLVIDYDTDGADDDELAKVPQGDGSLSYALVSSRPVEPAAIDLDHIAHNGEVDR